MSRWLSLGAAGTVALLLCGEGGAFAQTPAQRVAAWSQAIMLRRIKDAQKAEAFNKLDAELRQLAEPQPSALLFAPEPILRQTRSRARWLALEAAGARSLVPPR